MQTSDQVGSLELSWSSKEELQAVRRLDFVRTKVTWRCAAQKPSLTDHLVVSVILYHGLGWRRKASGALRGIDMTNGLWRRRMRWICIESECAREKPEPSHTRSPNLPRPSNQPLPPNEATSSTHSTPTPHAGKEHKGSGLCAETICCQRCMA
jgi:hypothetical protein